MRLGTLEICARDRNGNAQGIAGITFAGRANESLELAQIGGIPGDGNADGFLVGVLAMRVGADGSKTAAPGDPSADLA